MARGDIRNAFQLAGFAIRPSALASPRPLFAASCIVGLVQGGSVVPGGGPGERGGRGAPRLAPQNPRRPPEAPA